MADFIDSLNRALKYGREKLPVSAIHPELRFTRLGAVLREHATEPSDVGELAHQALTSPHDQPLELMPLHLLRDKMQEESDHPLAGQFQWATLPEKVSLDQAIRGLSSYNRQYLRKKYAESDTKGQWHKDRGGLYTPDTDPLNKLRGDFQWLTPDELDKSVSRVNGQSDFEQLHRNWEEDQAPTYAEQIHDILLPSLNTPDHKYA